MPFSVGAKGDKIILGKYNPTTDSMAILASNLIKDIMSNYKPYDNPPFSLKTIENYFSGSEFPLEKETWTHEYYGHVFLTKQSSLWIMLYLFNLNSCLLFDNLIKFTKFTKHKINKTEIGRTLKNGIKDMIWTEEFVRNLIILWRPLQEAIANLSLYILKENTDDLKIKNSLEELIVYNKNQSHEIRYLTEEIEYLLKEFGHRNGSEMLYMMSLIASSPKIFTTHIPKDYEDFKSTRRDLYEKGKMRKGIKDISPFYRFAKMTMYASQHITEIKNLMKKDIALKDLIFRVSKECGCEIQAIDAICDRTIRICEKIINDETMPHSTKSSFIVGKKFLVLFTKIMKTRNPTFWFVKEKTSNKLYFIKNHIAKENPKLETYMHLDTMKYQFLNSMISEKDMIKCYKELTTCELGCKSCATNVLLTGSRELYRRVSKFSYEELRREAMDENWIESAIFK